MEFCAVGGYSEVGQNMSALRVGDEVVTLDMGFYLPKLMDFEEEGGDRRNLTTDGLIRLGAIPNDAPLAKWRPLTKAVVLSHCHLDHLGATPYLAPRYGNAPVLGTPYTTRVLRDMIRDERLSFKQPIKTVNPNSFIRVSKNIEIEFIGVTHSTIQTAIVAVHTPEGIVLYANDFKFDQHPIVGQKPNLKRLRQFSKENVVALVIDALYAHAPGKTPSERVARHMLEDVLLNSDNAGNAIFTTTFASHIPRLKSLIEFGSKLNRKVVFLGRSLLKYARAAEAIQAVNFSSQAEIVGSANRIAAKLQEIEKKGKDNYLVVCTGGQGEQTSVLNKIMTKQLPFDFAADDHMVFSNRTIPVPINIANRARLEEKLRRRGVRIFKDVHVSGHVFREDIRDLFKMVKPQHVIPCQGNSTVLSPCVELAKECGYQEGKSVHLFHDGQKISL